MGADAYLPNEKFSNDEIGGHNASVSSFRSTKRSLKEKTSPQEKQNDDKINKSLTFCLNGKWKTERCRRDLWETAGNRLRLTANKQNRGFVKLKI